MLLLDYVSDFSHLDSFPKSDIAGLDFRGFVIKIALNFKS